jgi:hypothetical protein
MASGKAIEVVQIRITAARRRAIGGEGWEYPVEMIGLCWLHDSRLRMTQIREECPNWTLMTSTFPDLPRPNRRGFPRDATMSHTIIARPRKRRLGGEQRRALQLLACSPFGATEAIMHVHGFARPMLAKLVRAGLATVQSETGKAIAVGRIRITDAGRRWLEDAAKSALRGPNRFKDFWRE